MRTFEIYKNFGCLASEKTAVWTVGNPCGTSAVSEKMIAEVPDGWSVYESVSGELCAENENGTYSVNDILVRGDDPAFIDPATGKKMQLRVGISAR